MGNSPQSRTLVTLGIMIKRFREAKGLTQRDLAAEMNYSQAWVSDTENARSSPTPTALTCAEDALGIPRGTLTDVLELTRVEIRTHPVESFERFTHAENTASEIHGYEALVVPGLLQTPDYARALIMAEQPHARPELVDDMVRLRMERQAILARDDPPVHHLVIAEGALRQPMGGRDVHRDQLASLLDAASKPGLTMQVIPLDVRNRAGLISSFRIMTFLHAPSVAYSEDPASGHLQERPELVRIMWRAYDVVRSNALNVPDSFELMKRLLEEV